MDPNKLNSLVQKLVANGMRPLQKQISELQKVVSSLSLRQALEGQTSSIPSGEERGDPKGNLINLCATLSPRLKPIFHTTQAGPLHKPQFSCTVIIGQHTFYGPQQPKKKLAESEASKMAKEILLKADRTILEIADSQAETCPVTNNSANVLPHFSNWLESKPTELGGRISIDVFCNSFSGLKPSAEGITYHFSSGMREAADHEISFFAGKYMNQWKHSKVVVLVISKDLAIKNTVMMLKREQIHSLLKSPCQISSQYGVESIFQSLCDTLASQAQQKYKNDYYDHDDDYYNDDDDDDDDVYHDDDDVYHDDDDVYHDDDDVYHDDDDVYHDDDDVYHDDYDDSRRGCDDDDYDDDDDDDDDWDEDYDDSRRGCDDDDYDDDDDDDDDWDEDYDDSRRDDDGEPKDQ
ncbi:hypothetical protein GUITHDRAFT_109582 [Guillardia theta CCMP2712]|uniref:DRBM domain-containing protein n=1 Tax=Guillardia theta (strain CCMP2712) TaxID=905079 RepID=L1J8N0_GUITC|nr:hypothetical protein GUITHDRAFT_109582 [Guillardia theta CCMP2712]EKX44459.1 hypothetical protein GUITHDRAFT_109582 [Guillardia theta CCMP2712]|eukprot:XP_005831439.1 hypothetical protein GUITHDRAFT_109582 [Guillardia theta CCMP2712]